VGSLIIDSLELADLLFCYTSTSIVWLECMVQGQAQKKLHTVVRLLQCQPDVRVQPFVLTQTSVVFSHTTNHAYPIHKLVK
jgi:hypothetical protein